MKQLGWNHQQVCLEGTEAKILQRKGEIDVWCRKRNVIHNPDEVYRPEVVVHETLEEKFQGDCFAVVHAALGRIVADDPVHNNNLLPALGVS